MGERPNLAKDYRLGEYVKLVLLNLLLPQELARIQKVVVGDRAYCPLWLS